MRFVVLFILLMSLSCFAQQLPQHIVDGSLSITKSGDDVSFKDEATPPPPPPPYLDSLVVTLDISQ